MVDRASIIRENFDALRVAGQTVKFGLDTIQKKCGWQSTAKEFKRLIKTIVEQEELHQHFPDYTIRLDEEADHLIFTPRSEKAAVPQDPLFPRYLRQCLGKGAQSCPQL